MPLRADFVEEFTVEEKGCKGVSDWIIEGFQVRLDELDIMFYN